MARRQVLDTGLGVNVLSALTGSITEQLQKKRQAEQELKQVFAKALLEEELKNRYDPERIAKTQALDVATSASTLPRPAGGFNQAELQAGIPQAIEGQESTNRLKFLQQYGLLPQRQPSLAETIAQMKMLEESSTTPVSPQEVSSSSTGVTQPGQSFPILNRLQQAGRSIGRTIGARETQEGFQESFAAQTAAAAKGFGDTANIAVEERKMIAGSFDRDGETIERRNSRRQRLNNFFDEKEAKLNSILKQPVPQILKGYSRFGPRYEADPAIQQARRQAAQDLSRLQQTRVLYTQMWKEADSVLPAIGTQQGQQGGRLTPQQAKARGAVGRDEETGEYVDANGQPVR